MTDAPDRPQRPLRPHRSARGPWILIYVLLAPAVVLPLLVPTYDKVDPTLFGFPFFYWFQFAMIIGAAVLTLTAFMVSTRSDERDRVARRKARNER